MPRMSEEIATDRECERGAGVKKIFNRINSLFADARTQDQIIAAIDPWVLACAVGALNGSCYATVGSQRMINFDNRLRMIQKHWLPRITEFTGTSDGQVINALKAFTEKNRHMDMCEVLVEVQRSR